MSDVYNLVCMGVACLEWAPEDISVGMTSEEIVSWGSNSQPTQWVQVTSHIEGLVRVIKQNYQHLMEFVGGHFVGLDEPGWLNGAATWHVGGTGVSVA